MTCLKKDLHTVPLKLSPKLHVLRKLVATLLILEGKSLLRNPQALQISNTDHVWPQNDHFVTKKLSKRSLSFHRDRSQNPKVSY